jgi:hypothetical protein
MVAEPWRRFEARVDHNGLLELPERARRAKISCRSFLRSNARKAAKSRAAGKDRREAALRRRLTVGPSASEVAAFARERDDFVRSDACLGGMVFGPRPAACYTDAGSPTRPALTCHRRAAAASSYDALLEVWGLRLAKYLPVTPSTSGEDAR